MKKNERFFGLHFDFHAGNEVEIGTRTDVEDIEWFINETKPDFVQCDCKGHPGNASYLTKVGHAAEKLKTDNLRIWCDTIKKHNLPVYVHYSGVIDTWYTKHNPENARWDENGNIDEIISFYGDYCEKYMIPQLKELIEEYDIDGAWIDGEAWAVKRDYSPKAAPHFRDDMDDSERCRITRKAFYDYVKKYVDAVHSIKPDFKITSNWMYTSQSPDEPTVDIDFISGDFAPYNSVHSVRFDTRCIANQGKPWDLMAWSFSTDHLYCHIEKSAVQLMQEAAMVLSQGGGFQMYVFINSDGSVRKTRSSKFREIAEFVRKRYINFEKKTKAQVAVYFSADSAYSEKNGEIIFKPEPKTPVGIMDCVLDMQYTCGVVLQHQWQSFDDYEIIIVPEWKYLTDIEIERLKDYANRGGKLVVTGADLAVKIGGFSEDKIQRDVVKAIADKDSNFIRFKNDFIDLGEGSGTIYTNMDLRDAELAGFKTVACGDGSITYIPFNFGELYFKNKNFIFIDYLKTVLNSLSMPHIVINKKNIDITVQQNGDTTFINIINMRQNRHSLEYTVYDEVPEVYNVEITFDKEYNNITMPLGEEFEYEIKGGKTVVKLKKLEIHSIIELN